MDTSPLLMGDNNAAKKLEYVHETYYDSNTKGKWTIFNKQCYEIEEPVEVVRDWENEYECPED